MQTILLFQGKLIGTGEILEQRIPVSDPSILQDRVRLLLTIQNHLVTLGIGGMVHKVGDRMTITPGARFENIWCDVPNIVIASPGDEVVG